MKMIKSVITAFALMMTAQAAQAITIVPVRVSVPVVRVPISIAKPTPVVVAKAAPVVVAKAAVPTKTTPAVADDVVVAKSSAVVPHTTNVAMMTATTTGSSTNKCADKEKAKKYKECRKPSE